MKNEKLNFVILFLFLNTLVFAQTNGFDRYDVNKDKNISKTEFNDLYSQHYNTYDTDRNGKISDKEFYDQSFKMLDRDQNGNLNDKEWKTGYDNIYKDHLKSDRYSKYDSDRNKNMSNEEYHQSFEQSDYYSSYDTNRDNNIDRDELNTGTFNRWDRNQDGKLDENEYNHYHSIYNR
jgi:hypothetical protein